MTWAALNFSTGGTVVGYPLKFATFYVAAGGDAAMFVNEAGVIPVACFVLANATGGATAEHVSYMTVRANGANSTVTAAQTSATYNEAPVGITRPSGGYYIQNLNSREIMYVTSDSAPTAEAGTFTVIRGCLGTSIKAITDDDYLACMNMVVATGLAVAGPIAGYRQIAYFALPHDYRANLFKAA